MKRILLLILIVIVPSYIFASEKVKTDNDRIIDIHQIAGVMEEFKALLGDYPFAEQWKHVPDGMAPVPILCNLSHHPLPERYQYPPPGTSGYMMTAKQFESYLSKYLNREIILPKDDRPVEKMGKKRPFFYQFMFDGSDYFISLYLTEPHKFSRKIADGWYKYQVGSVAIPDRKIIKYSTIK